jgi:hypothetical protein
VTQIWNGKFKSANGEQTAAQKERQLGRELREKPGEAAGRCKALRQIDKGYGETR